MLHAGSFRHGKPDDPRSADRVVLAHDERHLRRKALTLESGDRLMVDLAEPVALAHGDLLVLDDGRTVNVVAADEELYEIRADGPLALSRLAWHLGNRHLPTQIDADRILIQRDHVIRNMLQGLGARVTEVLDQFHPVRGAYSGHGHQDHAHGHSHDHHHDAHHHEGD